jgi:uncharacterized protein YdgA (DUF945 family)
MRRIVSVLVFLIAAAGLAPKAVGFLVADHHERLVTAVASSLRGVEISSDQTESGWFTTSARHRVRVSDPAAALLIADLTGRPAAEARPALIVDSQIAHGPWPLFEGPPGIARMQSRLAIDIGGESIPIPGAAVTDIAFDGSGNTSMVFDRLDTTVRGGASVLMWDGARLDIDYDPRFERIRSSGHVGSLTMLGPQGELRVGAADLEGRSSATPFGFRAGTSRLAIRDLAVTGVDGSTIEAGNVSLDIEVAVDGESVGHVVVLDVDGLRSDDIDLGTVRLSAGSEGLAASVLGRLGKNQTVNAMEWLGVMRPGAVIRVEEFSFRGDRGDAFFTGYCRVPEDAATDGPAELAGVLVGEARLSISTAMVDIGPGSRVGQLLTTGYLTQTDNGELVAEIRIGSGLMTVNGRPLPLPMIYPR